MPLRLFLAEDNFDEAYLFKRAAKGRFDISHASNGEEACKLLLTEAPPDLLVTDLKMPLKDGFEVTKWIRSLEDLKDVKIVVLSSSAEERDARAAYAAGADLFVCKPNTAAGYARLMNILDNHHVTTPTAGELKILHFDFEGSDLWWKLGSDIN